LPRGGRVARAEQTGRSLTQGPEDYDGPGEIAGRIPQVVETGGGGEGATTGAGDV